MSFALYDTLNSLLMAVFGCILWRDACWNMSEEWEMIGRKTRGIWRESGRKTIKSIKSQHVAEAFPEVRK